MPRPTEPPTDGRPTFESFGGRTGHDRLLNRVVPGPDGPLILQIAAPLAADDHELRELLTVMLLAGPLALAVALGGGYLLAYRALAPVDRMAADADQITATRLDRRLDIPNPDDELGRLGATLNGMIGRLERSFEEIRRFTADAAHELRTPLTVMRNVAEVALRSPREPEQYRRVLGDMLEEVERLTRLAEQLLFLCREDAGLIPLATTMMRLDDLVTRRRRAHERRRRGEGADSGMRPPGGLSDPRGCRPAPPAPLQPAGQRDQVHAGRRDDPRDAGTIGRLQPVSSSRTRGSASRPNTSPTSSSGSTASTRRGVRRRAAPGSAWRSAGPSRRRMAGTCRSRAPSARGRGPLSPCPCRHRPASETGDQRAPGRDDGRATGSL